MIKTLPAGLPDRLRPWNLVLLGIAPVMAAATTLLQAAVLAASGSLILILTGMALRPARRILPVSAFVPFTIITAVVLVSIVVLTVQSLDPDLRRNLGIYLPLQAVNCLILVPVAGTGSRECNGPGAMFLTAAVRYAVLICALGLVREAFGRGTVLGWPLFGAAFRDSPVLFFSLAPGAFVTLGLFAGLHRRFRNRGGS